MIHHPFDSTQVRLTGTNLIEASAGTGKTYSIAIMVLRLVLEENLSIREILMVTFTKAAVAELEERIRAFIRKAHRAATGHCIDDPTIQEIVTRSMITTSNSEVQHRLQEAILFLDETAVMTIHGFCQQTLTEFAFETGQVFGAETIQDPSTLLQEQVNKFWRKQVTTMPEPLLKALLDAGLSRSLLTNVVSEHLNGKRYLPYKQGNIYQCTGDQHAQWIEAIESLQQKEQELIRSVHSYILNNKEQLLLRTQKKSQAVTALSHLIEEPANWLAVIKEKQKKVKYITELFPDILDLCSDCDIASDKVKAQLTKILSHLYCIAIAEISKALAEVKLRHNLIAFDDMIGKVHSALHGPSNKRLVHALQQKYKAVFIDEFQDTDKLQYEIFDAAFGSDSIIFYIGDPKQSIYAWRKADLQTYFRARNTVHHVYEMNINFRSSSTYIQGMNEFFDVDDPFYFRNDADAIEYIKVDAPSKSFKGSLLLQGVESKPISLVEAGTKGLIQSGVAGEVIRLLDKNVFQLQQKGTLRAVCPSDIGILVRSNRDAAEIKKELARYGIPAVTIGDTKVLQSDEAIRVWHFLIAMEEPTAGNINRALITPLTGYDSDTVLFLKEEVLTDMFKGFRKSWEESGVYTAMMNLVAGFNIRAQLLSGNTEQGERSITNLFQLIELIHKVQVRQNFSTLELIAWLKRGIDGMDLEGDEYEQRVESDEDSVKIITIHKSKGLEYNIVLCPTLDQSSDNPTIKMVSFREGKSADDDYVSVEKVNMTPDQQLLSDEQATQEKRRMIYVAITRAVYKCFIYKTTGTGASDSALNPFVSGRDFTESASIDRQELSIPPEKYKYRQEARKVPAPLQVSHFRLEQPNWRKVSYSSLAAKHEFHVKPTLGGHTSSYDRFMFYQLAKGAHTGNMLHFIFEQISFSSQASWGFIIDKAISQFAPGRRELYTPLLMQLLDTIMHIPIRLNGALFSLSEVAEASKVPEFEFDFSINGLQPSMLNALSNDTITIALKEQSELEGLMNGLIDLLFFCQGKFYILDWKSNYLGDSLDDYSQDKLAEAMNENNYHLQYLLYTVAARKYLKARLGAEFDFDRDFGGVIYLFVRGIRKGQVNGIYTTVPSTTLLKELESLLFKTTGKEFKTHA